MSGTIARQVVEALADPSSTPPEGLFAPGAVTWHSFDEVEAPTVPDTFASLVAIRAVVPDFTMSELRTGDRYAQYVVTGTLPDGSTLRAPAATWNAVCGPGRSQRAQRPIAGAHPA